MSIGRTHWLGSLAVASAVVLAATGCGGSNDMTDLSATDTQAAAQDIAPAAADAGPQGDIAAGAILDLMTGSSAAPAGIAAAVTVVTPNCPATFTRPNGLTGSCTANEDGSFTYTFGGTVDVHGVPTEVTGQLVATPAPQQPQSGTAYTVSLSATATNSKGSATWSATGTVILHDGGTATLVRLDVAMVVTPNGGASRSVTVAITPSQIVVTRTGPLGHVARITLDRSTMTGTLQIDGHTVANVTASGGCLSIDYLNPAWIDVTICDEPAA